MVTVILLLKFKFIIGHDMNMSDYDRRTALHLAVAENHPKCVKYLVQTCKVEIQVKDR